MINKKLFIFLAFLLFIPVVFAGYYKDVPVDVQITVQHDDGMNITDVTGQVCIISVFSNPLDALIYEDVPMVNGSVHHFSFTPNQLGVYVISVKCVYGNETGLYYDSINVETRPVDIQNNQPSVVNLNAEVFPDKSSYYVNLGKTNMLSFNTEYYVNGKLTNSNYAEYKIVKDDKILAKGGFKITSTGVYKLEYDLKDFVEGDYKVFLAFDGKTKVVDLKVDTVSKDWGFIATLVQNEDGSWNKVKIGLALISLIFILMLFIVLFRLLSKGKSKKK
jgi:hypothetical protein